MPACGAERPARGTSVASITAASAAVRAPRTNRTREVERANRHFMEARHAEFSGVACKGDDDDAAKSSLRSGPPSRRSRGVSLASSRAVSGRGEPRAVSPEGPCLLRVESAGSFRPGRPPVEPVHPALLRRASGRQPGGASGVHDLRRLLEHADRRRAGTGRRRKGLRFRLRRSTGYGDVKETLIDTGTAAFADGPGEYLYQLRTENNCGEASEWSRPARVVVGTSKTSALVLVSGPEALPRVGLAELRGVHEAGGPERRQRDARRHGVEPGWGARRVPERIPDRVG